MKTTATFVIVVLFSLSCSSPEPRDREFMLIRRGGELDTIQWDVRNDTVQNDTFYCLTGAEYWNGKVDFSYQFPKKSSMNCFSDYKLVDEKAIKFESEEYKVLKYKLDMGVDDGAMAYFYSPKFGVIIYKSISWNNYARLTCTGRPEDDKIVFYLNEKILQDESFF